MTRKPDLVILNLGWGVQSFTLAAMVAERELPMIDFAIHSDTTHEQEATYRFAARWTPYLESKGVKVVTVKAENTQVVVNRNELPIPAFTLSPDGSRGQLRRQCTDKWKIRPIRKYLRELMGNKRNFLVEQWLGISLDEVERARHSDVKYLSHIYPLLDKRMTRGACIQWLTQHGLEIPLKSSCVFCPYHNRAAWSDLTRNSSDFERACLADEAIRDIRPPYPLFVHPARQPLRQLDLRSAIDFGQLKLWSEECSGVCFV